MPMKPLTAALMLGLALGGCAGKPLVPSVRNPAVGLDQGSAPGGLGGAPIPGSQSDFAASVTSDTIYFETDRYNMDAGDVATLRSQAQWLARHPGRRITVEGHSDERGTRDYNLALGERRANAARNYLVGLGVDPARIATVSHGKERPLALGSDEASWARNRRAVTVTVQ